MMNENYEDFASELDDHSYNELERIIEYLDSQSFAKIINKMTDFAEIMTEGKLSGLVNFQYKLNSTQTGSIIDFLTHIQAVTRIHNVSLKGSRDLAVEYVSNMFTDTQNPEGISSFLSIRNIIENRLTHQTQQYNSNMGKTNTTMAMPVNELRGHVRIYRDLTKSNLSISTKAQHGIIAASLHDAYVKFILRSDWYNDRTYMKFFFNEDDPQRRETLILSQEQRVSLNEISNRVKLVIQRFIEMKSARLSPQKESGHPDYTSEISMKEHQKSSQSREFNDKMLMTPFGSQYGKTIDRIINTIFTRKPDDNDDEQVKHSARLIFEAYQKFPDSITNDIYQRDIRDTVHFLINTEIGIKSFAERYIYWSRKELFGKIFTPQVKQEMENFLHECFKIYFDGEFEPVFRIIRSLDVKKYACAYILKRIYFLRGETLGTFGYFLINTIAKISGIKV